MSSSRTSNSNPEALTRTVKSALMFRQPERPIKYNNRKSRKLILFSRFPSFSALTQYRHTSGPGRSKAAINRINRLTRGYVLGTLIATVSRGKRFILSTANIIHRYLWINHLAPGVKTKAFNIIVSHRRVPSLRRKWKIKLRVCYS